LVRFSSFARRRELNINYPNSPLLLKEGWPAKRDRVVDYLRNNIGSDANTVMIKKSTTSPLRGTPPSKGGENIIFD